MYCRKHIEYVKVYIYRCTSVCSSHTSYYILCERCPCETVPVIVIVGGLLMLPGLRSSVWYSSRQPTTCAGVGVQGCVRQTQTALNIMTLLNHVHSMCASAQLISLLLGLLVQTYVVRMAHVAWSSCCSCCTTVGVTLSNTLRPLQLALKPLVQVRSTDTTQ